jgi:hypothetical protein
MHNFQSLLRFLTELGFKEIETKMRGKTQTVLRIEADKYDAIMAERKGDIPYEDWDGEPDPDAF